MQWAKHQLHTPLHCTSSPPLHSMRKISDPSCSTACVQCCWQSQPSDHAQLRHPASRWAVSGGLGARASGGAPNRRPARDSSSGRTAEPGPLNRRSLSGASTLPSPRSDPGSVSPTAVSPPPVKKNKRSRQGKQMSQKHNNYFNKYNNDHSDYSKNTFKDQFFLLKMAQPGLGASYSGHRKTTWLGMRVGRKWLNSFIRSNYFKQ